MFSEIYRTGKRSRKGGLVVLSAPSRDIGGANVHEAKIGFVAGRKVGNAVHRNRAKRRMREAARRVDLPAGTDLVLIATPAVNEVSFELLCGWLSDALAGHTMTNKELS